MLTLPISVGKPDNELFDKSRTERCNLHASTGYSFNCMHNEIISRDIGYYHSKSQTYGSSYNSSPFQAYLSQVLSLK